MSNKKIVVILSGGLDSTTLLYYLMQDFDCKAITFNYGQKHNTEITSAIRIADNLGIPHFVFNLSDFSSIARSSLTRAYLDIPEGHYTDDSMKSTVVPNRNLTMISIATTWAISINAIGVATGVHAGDHAIYPDCRTEFIVHAETVMKIANEGFISPEFQIVAPFVHLSKTDIVKLGNDLQVPFERTWSCYNGRDLHCGKCGTCVERKEAFSQAGVDDPTTYEA